MFNNTEEEDREMVYAVADAIREEIDRQIKDGPGGPRGLDDLAIVAIMAMVRWARSHPVPRWFNDNERTH